MKKIFALFMLVFILMTFLPARQVFAQDSAWSEVVDGNGNILYDRMTDQGVVTQAADWMPSITLPVVGTVSVPAEYHSYVTESGNTVLMPTVIQVGQRAGQKLGDQDRTVIEWYANSMKASGDLQASLQNAARSLLVARPNGHKPQAVAG
jgi:hypothetical protein